MKKPLTTSVLMAIAGFFVGWQSAPPLFAWFVTALDGFFRVPDPGLWIPVYLRFAFGTAALFAAQVWTPRIAHNPAPFAPTILIYLLIGITGSIAEASFWHWRISDFRRDLLLFALVLPPTPSYLPCLSIPLVGVVTSLCVALLYRWRRSLHRLFDDIFRHHAVRHDY
jgi:hypothetical protein